MSRGRRDCNEVKLYEQLGHVPKGESPEQPSTRSEFFFRVRGERLEEITNLGLQHVNALSYKTVRNSKSLPFLAALRWA
jgi:hypothetical protein